MVKRINGVVEGMAPPIVPLVEMGGVAVPLPPLTELHANNLPGGTMHATATEQTAGFMSAEQVRRLGRVERELERRPVIDPADLASAEHQHPPVYVPHEHQETDRAVAALEATVPAMKGRIDALEARPIFDGRSVAPANHDHPEKPLPHHGHPEFIESRASAKALAAQIEELKVELADARNAHAQLAEQVAFMRDLTEKALARAAKAPEHGQQPGGRMHEPASERLAGFMTPLQRQQLIDALRRIEAVEGQVRTLQQPG